MKNTLPHKNGSSEQQIQCSNMVYIYLYIYHHLYKGSEFMDGDVLNNFFKLIVDNFNEIGIEFGEFIVDIYLEILLKPNLSDNMIKLIVWVVGEIGS
jgi:hypothetical protein